MGESKDSPTEISYDVALIGGGVIGCAIAWRLAASGLQTVVIERNEPGMEASFAAGGMLAAQAESDPAATLFPLALSSRNAYPKFVRDLEDTSSTSVGYRSEGTLVLSLRPEDDEQLESDYAAQTEAGLEADLLTDREILDLEPSITSSVRFALHFPGDHQVDNRLLVRALEEAARKAGAEFRLGTEAFEVCARAGQVSSISTSSGSIRTKNAVIAAGCWSGKLTLPSPLLSSAGIVPVRGQMMAFSAPSSILKSVVYSARGYVIPRSTGVIIAGSTTERAGFTKATTEAGLTTIESAASEILPTLSNLPIVERWAGLRPGTADDLPVLGEDPIIKGLYYATGHYRNGILLTPITAQVITELILNGRTSTDISSFSITRFADR